MGKQLTKQVESLLKGGLSKEEIRVKLSQGNNLDDIDRILDIYPDQDMMKKYKGLNLTAVILLISFYLINFFMVLLSGHVFNVAVLFGFAVGVICIVNILKMVFLFYPIVIIIFSYSILNSIGRNSLGDFFYVIKLIISVVLVVILFKIWFGAFPKAKRMLGMK